jgi:hypothetical protein
MEGIARHPTTRLIVAFIVYLVHSERPRDGAGPFGGQALAFAHWTAQGDVTIGDLASRVRASQS